MRKRAHAGARTKAQVNRTAKVAALVKRAGTPGEQAAAEAALVRLGGPPAPPTNQGTHLTDAVVKRLRPPERGNRITFDADPAGFGCRVTAAGSKAFIFNYRVKTTGQQRRVTIGQFPNWTIGAARAEAKRLRHLVDGGGDPRGDFEDLKAAPTVAELCDRFEREHLPRKRPATVESYTRLLRLHIRPHFGAFTKVADVAYSDIDKLHRNVTKKGSVYSANRCVAVLSKMFSLAIRWQWRIDNPAKGIERNPEVKRKRYLSGGELAQLSAALSKHPDNQFANIVRLLLLTGARRGEVLAMRWADLDLDRGIWSKPGSTTKQKTDHIVPLSAPARQLLSGIKTRGEFVFPGDGQTGHVVEVKKAWATLCKEASIAGLRIHDLRHSFASQLVSSGASLPLIGALLGHSNPTTTARYSHLFDDPQRAAVEKVGAIVGDAAVSGRRS
jgi:integrase